MKTGLVAVLGFGALAGMMACKDEPAVQRVAPPTASAQPASAAASKFAVAEKGTASFLIDAPLEKIKGRSGRLRGEITLDPADLASARGEVDVDLMDLATETFGDASQNAAQTGHAHNWLEIGDDVEAKHREENRFARFTIQEIGDVSSKLADVAESNGERKVMLTARGNLWVHGVSSPKTVKLAATFQGPPAAPTGLRITTIEPLTLSLKEHDVKPRDVAGKFLNGALEKVGKKIDDTVQISLDVTARSGKS
jgi:polyisoprenoid-binding protein YceI